MRGMTLHTVLSPLLRPALVTLVSLSLGLVGCGDGGIAGGDTGTSDGAGTSDGLLPDAELDPSDLDRVIVQAAIEVGESIEEAVGIINTGGGVLTVRGYELSYEAPAAGDDGDHPAFELVTAFDTELQVHPEGGEASPQRVEVRIRFTHKEDGLPRTATLRIETDDPDEAELQVTFTSVIGQPRLNVAPSEIDFALVAEGETGERELTMLNVGAKTVLVSGFQLTDDRFGVKGDDFDIGCVLGGPTSVDLPEPIAVGAGSAKQISVTFCGESKQPAEGALIIYSNDPDTGVSGLLVPLLANKNGPCIQVDPLTAHFGGQLVGDLATIDVEISSCGTEPVEITGLWLTVDSSTDFALDEGAILALNGGQLVADVTPLVLPVNDSVKVPVRFMPDGVNAKDIDNTAIPDEGTFIIESNAFQTPCEVPLLGAGVEEDCPVAVIAPGQGGQVAPQTTLYLDGAGSYAPSGAIDKWSWTVEQPDDGQQIFVPSPTSPAPTFYADAVGVYTFTLDVWDENNTKSCQPDVLTVVVQE